VDTKRKKCPECNWVGGDHAASCPEQETDEVEVAEVENYGSESEFEETEEYDDELEFDED